MSHSEDEDSEFRKAVQGVKPLVQDRHHPTPRPVPLLQQRARDEAEIMAGTYYHVLPEHETGEELHFRNNLPTALWKKLQRGQFHMHATLDLHGLTPLQAESACREFLKRHQQNEMRCVRIIYGKGLHSKDKPVLRSLVHHWLTQWSWVLACCPARECDGGRGAVYVLLRKKR